MRRQKYRRGYKCGIGRTGRFFAAMRVFRARERQCEKIESFDDMCLRIEQGED